MVGTGNPCENAIVGSLFKRPRHEEVNTCEVETYQEAIVRLTDFIEEVHTDTRLHSELGYRP